MTSKVRTAGLIDGDILVYQVACSVEREIHWGDDEWTLHSDMAEARPHADDWIAHIKEELELDGVILAFSDPVANFRREILPSYKANRKNKRKPVVWKALREYLQETYE